MKDKFNVVQVNDDYEEGAFKKNSGQCYYWNQIYY